ncbi:MAG TPA: formylmethanofuran dehydrogenase [Desulfobacterales bacterium]|nr:formylmethanofuran dehydrogenase [Desulfobacterales bacterium]
MDFSEVVKFHGHVCPGLTLGFRAATLVMNRMELSRSDDEELVAIVENNSCAVDAIQVVTGCTLGKGNLILRDYGKQVYTFIRRGDGESLRLAVKWQPPTEDAETARAWQSYMAAERTAEVMTLIKKSKNRKIRAIQEAADTDLFKVGKAIEPLPPKAQVFPSLICALCGEKVMAPKIITQNGKSLCRPCLEAKNPTTAL